MLEPPPPKPRVEPTAHVDTKTAGQLALPDRGASITVDDSGLAVRGTPGTESVGAMATYIPNAVDALVAALDRCEQARGQALVVTNGEPRTITDLLTGICAAADQLQGFVGFNLKTGQHIVRFSEDSFGLDVAEKNGKRRKRQKSAPRFCSSASARKR